MLWWRQENIYQCHVFLHKKRHEKKKKLHLWNEALSSTVYWYRMYFMLCANHFPSLCAVISKRCNNRFCSCLEEQKNGPHGTLLQHALNSLTVILLMKVVCPFLHSFLLLVFITGDLIKKLGPYIASIIHIVRKWACPVAERSGFNNITVAIIML